MINRTIKHYRERLLLGFYSFGIGLYFMSILRKFMAHPGDQDWFRETISNMDYRYLDFAILRYSNWSSRLLLESGTAFFSVHQNLFLISTLLSSFLMIYTAMIALSDNKQEIFKEKQLIFIAPLLFLLFFEVQWFLSAGLIATYTVYFFPMLSLFLAINLVGSQNKVLKLIGFLLNIVTILQEQFAALLLLFGLYLFLKVYVVKRQISKESLGLMFFSIIGLLNIKLSPGNVLRTSQEITNWFPGFKDISLFDKIMMSYLETNKFIFSDQYLFVLIFLMICAIIAILRTDYLSLMLSVLVLSGTQFLDVFHSYEFSALVSQKIRENQVMNWELSTLLAICIYTIMLLLIVILIFRLIDNIGLKVEVLFLLFSGYASRMAIAFSPTLYASSDRTIIPFVFCTWLSSLLLIFYAKKLLDGSKEVRSWFNV